MNLEAHEGTKPSPPLARYGGTDQFATEAQINCHRGTETQRRLPTFSTLCSLWGAIAILWA
jgi:hypothetical protein